MSPIPNAAATETPEIVPTESKPKLAAKKTGNKDKSKARAARKVVASAHSNGSGKSLRAKADGRPADRAKTIHGVICPSGKFWNDKRVLIVKTLRKLGATTAEASRPASRIAEKSGGGLESYNVVRYCSDGEPLVKGGLVRKARMEGQTENTYYLTALGARCTFDY